MSRSLWHSLRVKILLAVLLCAVIPLAAVGAWFTASVSRAGERLLETQLDSVAARAATTAMARWELREADIALLAGNEPVALALGDPGDSSLVTAAGAYIDNALQVMPAISFVTVSDTAGRVVIARGLTTGASGVSRTHPRGARRDLTLHHDIVDAYSRRFGTLAAGVRLDGFLVSSSAPTDAGSGFVAVHALDNDAWLLPPGLTAELARERRFAWDGHEWITAARSLAEPRLEIIAMGPTDGFAKALEGITRAGALALGLVALAVVLLTYVVTGYLTGSLRHLATAADAVGRGNLDAQVRTTSDDEVGRVGRTFNQMTGRLRDMMHERSQQEAVAAMGELAATFAHQVRSPATAMRLDLERAHARVPAGSEERELVGRALEQLDRLERTATGSLRVARSAAAQLETVDIMAPLRRAIAGTTVDFAAAGVRTRASGVDIVAVVPGDEPALEQLFTNLLTNAVQASVHGGTVDVMVEVERETVKVAIVDEGVGMAAAALARAGEPFYSTKAGGTGLGLAIAKRIVDAHGAQWEIESAVGRGTRVTVVFGR